MTGDPVISFIIPVLNEQDCIGKLLTALEANFPDAECIVVDGGSSDQTQDHARQKCSELIVSEPGRATQMNAGAYRANGEYLFFLHADTSLRFTAQDLKYYIEQAPQWGFFPVRLLGSHPFYRVIESCMNLRSRLTQVATGDQLIYIRRDLFDYIAGYADIVLMEDIECCKRLRQLARPLIAPLRVATSARRWQQHGIIRTVFLMWILRLAYFLGISPARLSRYYFGR
ncbi:MAG: rSAM/selenodomain-associated transferase 2 [Halioglobus sp.]